MPVQKLLKERRKRRGGRGNELTRECERVEKLGEFLSEMKVRKALSVIFKKKGEESTEYEVYFLKRSVDSGMPFCVGKSCRNKESASGARTRKR